MCHLIKNLFLDDYCGAWNFGRIISCVVNKFLCAVLNSTWVH